MRSHSIGKTFEMYELATWQSIFGNYVAIFILKMLFSTEEKMIIRHYRLDKHYGVKRLLKKFPNKGLTKGGLNHQLRKNNK